ncbi:MAG: hypothetical protein U0L36_02780, partial [Acutalibacteraceae bacterium]|nr:hypothetical protein [Acutalibacteraceae bacterium]
MDNNTKEKNKQLKNIEAQEGFEQNEERELTLDEIENAPEDLDELFTEPPTLDPDFDEEPTDEDLKLEEMDIDKLNEDFTFDNIS